MYLLLVLHEHNKNIFYIHRLSYEVHMLSTNTTLWSVFLIFLSFVMYPDLSSKACLNYIKLDKLITRFCAFFIYNRQLLYHITKIIIWFIN